MEPTDTNDQLNNSSDNNENLTNLNPPRVVIWADVNNDGIVDQVESLNTPLQVSISFSDGTQIGDTLLVDINGQAQSYTITGTDLTTGSIKFDLPTGLRQGDIIAVSAYTVDQFGNSSNTGSNSAVVAGIATITSFTVNTDTITEGQDMIFTATANPSIGASIIRLISAGGTATNGVDTVTPLQVNFGSGWIDVSSNNTFVLPANTSTFDVRVKTVDDASLESSETVMLTIFTNNSPEVPPFTLSATASILDNDLALEDVHLNGVEDTALILSSTSFGIGSDVDAIRIISLPQDGVLQKKISDVWTPVAVNDDISQAMLSTGQLRFVSDANESGADNVNAAGEGNKKNDYTDFQFTIVSSGSAAAGSATVHMDIKPIADVINAQIADKAIAVSGNIAPQPGDKSNYYHATPGLKSWNGSSTSFSYAGLKLKITQPSPDIDGSERTMIHITPKTWGSYKPMLIIGSEIVGKLGETSTWTEPAVTNHTSRVIAVKGTQDYYQDSDGSYWINSSFLSKLTLTNSYSYNVRSSTYPTSSSAEHVTDQTWDYGYKYAISVETQELAQDGSYKVIDRYKLDLGEYTTRANSYNVYDFYTPLVFDLNDDGVQTIDYQSGQASFDYFGNGQPVQTGWASKEDGILTLDLNHNGKIDNGSELFGDQHVLTDDSKAADGFAALADYDSNHDAVINQDDDVFTSLLIWVDKDSDGISQSDELFSLQDLGITAISLSYHQDGSTDAAGNIHAMVGSFTTVDGHTNEIVDVLFKTASSSTAPEDVGPINNIDEVSYDAGNAINSAAQQLLDTPITQYLY